jgi:hypothetical protein
MAVAVPALFKATVWNFSNTWVLWQSPQHGADDAARIAEKRRGSC